MVQLIFKESPLRDDHNIHEYQSNINQFFKHEFVMLELRNRPETLQNRCAF